MKGVEFEKLNGSQLKIGIVASRWNAPIMDELLAQCKKGLIDSGVPESAIVVRRTPGAYEVPLGSKYLVDSAEVDAVIALGCLIKGETMHFEYIAEAVSQGLMKLGLDSGVPVIFGILTCLTQQQAVERTDHAYEWGQSAVEMALLKNQ